MTQENTQPKQPNEKGLSVKALLKDVTPHGVDPRVYYELVSTQIMGTDKMGKPRQIEDIVYFLSVANKLKLDPLLKQIYAVYRWDSRAGKERMIIQTGIDGFRAIAQRSKEYGGQDDPAFTVEETFNPVNNETVKQLKATVTVYKVVGGQRMPVTASTRWNEYAQKGKDKQGNEYYIGLWATMPYNQLSKTAEAAALRKAFPQDLSGVYISEELDRERGDIKSLDLPTPKAIEEKKAKKTTQEEAIAEGVKAISEVGVTSEQAIENLHQAEAEAKKAVEQPVASQKKQTELLHNFEEGAK